jgi:hypothetical protein
MDCTKAHLKPPTGLNIERGALYRVPPCCALNAGSSISADSACTRTSYQHQQGDGPPVDGRDSLDLASDEQGAVVTVQLKSVQYATCIRSTPLGMATCDTSSGR